jgi:hypothetical protein
MELRTQAQLVAFDPARAGDGAIGTIIPRAEFAETAARDEFPATFLLDLDRVEKADDGEVTDRATVAVDWDKDTIDQLLASTDEPEIALWFDERELAPAFDEVEAHSLRQRAAVLAVAVAAGGASATPAFARLAPDFAGGGAPAPSAQAPAATPTDSSGPSSGEVAAIVGAGVVLISAAGFGVARKRTRPVLPA